MVTEKDPTAPTADEMIAELENAKQIVANPPPWPIVGECFTRKLGHACAQCDGSHEHVWVAWHNPQWSALGLTGPGLPVRCMHCGARKCDTNDCMLRRHHGEPHERF